MQTHTPLDGVFQFLTAFDSKETGNAFFFGIVLVGLVLVLSLLPTARRKSTVYGSAHFAQRPEIMPLIVKFWERKNRLILGRCVGAVLPFFSRVGLTDKQQESHVLICAPPGKGKTSVVIIPGLLSEDGHRSLFINDIKRELINKCLGSLQEAGYLCYVLAPTRPEESHHYNPLRHVDSMEDAESLADCIITNTGSSAEPFWNNAGKLLLTATILHVLSLDPSAPLSALTDLLCKQSMSDAIQAILHSPSDLARNVGTAFLSSLPDNPKLAGSIVADMSSRLLGLQNPDVVAVTSDDDFYFSAFLEQPTAFILSIPASDTTRLKWLSAAFSMHLMTYVAKQAEKSPNGRLPRPLAFYLDEFANMGVIPNFLKHISLVRASGIAFILAIQNFSQLGNTYGEEGLETVKANAATHIIFSGGGQGETEFYSRRIGDQTVKTQSKNYQGGTTIAHATTQSEAGRPLMSADELRTMKTNQLVVLSESFPPIRLRSRPYFKQRRLKKRAGLPFSLASYPPRKKQSVVESASMKTPTKDTPINLVFTLEPEAEVENERAFLPQVNEPKTPTSHPDTYLLP